MTSSEDSKSPTTAPSSQSGEDMGNTIPRKAEEVREWMRTRHIDEVECVVPDIVGIARGKAMPRLQILGPQPYLSANPPSSFRPSPALTLKWKIGRIS